MHSDEITAREAMRILGYRDRSSISRLVSSGDLHPTRRLDGPGESGAAIFLRAEVEALRIRREAQRAAAGAS